MSVEHAAELPRELTCVDCGASAGQETYGWVAYRLGHEEDDEAELAFYCPACSNSKFGTD